MVTIARDNGYSMRLDFDENTITFDDFDGFSQANNASTLLDPLYMSTENDAGEPTLFQKNTDFSFDRYGDELVLRLGDYGIDLIEQDGLYLAPLQTMADFTSAMQSDRNFFYNGQCLLHGKSPAPDEAFIAVPAEARSEALCKYGYGELCMMLDHLYGLKETHGIDSFADLFEQIGFDEPLMDPDAAQADLAIYHLIENYLDDLHSSFVSYSYKTDAEKRKTLPSGRSKQALLDQGMAYAMALMEAFPEGVSGYQEVGNTAYITFDHFSVTTADSEEYYHQEFKDTIALIIKAHQQITREGSPIENVVLDLSCNTGGRVDAAMFTLAWFLGEASLSIKDNLTGAMATTTYRCDVNLDRTFDERDTVADKNLFCLISPVSFSCGNLLPKPSRNPTGSRCWGAHPAAAPARC